MSTAVAVVAFGAAFGYVEAAVVVYLRAALGLAPGAVMAHGDSSFGTFEAVEIARELATLAMIAAVGTLAGRTRLERLAWAAVVFGAWDIVYYLGLRLTIGWPPTFDTWDVLFLVPTSWVGPVWAPLVVSAALVAAGLAAARRLRAGSRIAVGPVRATGALAGGLLVVLSFLLANQDGSGPWAAWPVFWVGMALAIVATASALTARPSVPSDGGIPFQHGSERRPPGRRPPRPRPGRRIRRQPHARQFLVRPAHPAAHPAVPRPVLDGDVDRDPDHRHHDRGRGERDRGATGGPAVRLNRDRQFRPVGSTMGLASRRTETSPIPASTAAIPASSIGCGWSPVRIPDTTPTTGTRNSAAPSPTRETCFSSQNPDNVGDARSEDTEDEQPEKRRRRPAQIGPRLQ